MMIPVYRLADLQKKVTRINNRAAKHGAIAPFALTIGADVIRERHRTESGRPITVSFRDCELSGPEFKVAGFTFLARIDHNTTQNFDGNGRNLVCAAPGCDGMIPERYRTAAPHCDHCRVQRYRNDTFILRGADGEFRQIGRNCLADYIGHDAESIIALFTGYGRALADCAEESECWRGVRFSLGGEAVDVLAYTAAAIERFGWLSKAKADPDAGTVATAVIVADNLLSPEHAAKRGHDVIPAESHYETAEKAIAWVRNDLAGRRRLSDFESNLIALLSRDWIDVKGFGFACAAVFCYFRAIERDLTRKADAATRKPSQHVGKPGERVNLASVRVLGAYVREGSFGPVVHCYMRDGDGNNLLWYASGNCNLSQGDVINLRGTVKRHQASTRDGSPVTVLTRCAVIGEAPERLAA